jgi:hypothetical protein
LSSIKQGNIQQKSRQFLAAVGLVGGGWVWRLFRRPVCPALLPAFDCRFYRSANDSQRRLSAFYNGDGCPALVEQGGA